jgi:hypothetical protein
MADRIRIMAELGALMRDAEQRGDHAAAATCLAAIAALAEAHAEVAKVDDRRRRDRDRKRLDSVDSAESAEIEEFLAAPAPSPSSPTPPPTHTPTRESAHHAGGRAREGSSGPGGETVEEHPSDADLDPPTPERPSAETTRAMAERLAVQLGEHWGSVQAFVRSRERRTWRGWLKEVSKALLSGGCLPADVAGACDDALTARDELTGAKGFRAFCASHKAERQALERGEPPSRSGSGPPGSHGPRSHGRSNTPRQFDYSTASTQGDVEW